MGLVLCLGLFLVLDEMGEGPVGFFCIVITRTKFVKYQKLGTEHGIIQKYYKDHYCHV